MFSINSTFLAWAIATMAIALHPAQAFTPSTPSQNAAAASKTSQRFSSIAINAPTSSISDTVQQLLEQKKQEQKSRIPQGLPNVFHATSQQECMDIVENKLDRLTVFKFYSNFCRACKQVAPRFDRLAKENPDINVVHVQVTPANKHFVVEELGIPSLPYGGIFDPSMGLVETMNVKPQRFADFEQIVCSYRDGECQLPEDETDALAAPYITCPVKDKCYP